MHIHKYVSVIIKDRLKYILEKHIISLLKISSLRYWCHYCRSDVQFQAHYSCASREFEPQFGNPRDYPLNFQRARSLIIYTIANCMIRYNSRQPIDILAGCANLFYEHPFLSKNAVRSEYISCSTDDIKQY